MRFSTSPKHHLLRNSALLAALIVNTSVASAVGLTSAGVQVSNMMLSTAAPGSSELTFGGTVVNHLGLFDIVIVPTAALAANAGAMAAFNRAAAKWEAIFSDPITVTINADLMNLGSPSIIGSTSSVLLRGSFDTIRDELGIDSALDANDGINAFLPTSAQFSATVPSGFTLDGNLLATKANLKAMGFLGLDGLFGASDASILFNSGFAFDAF